MRPDQIEIIKKKKKPKKNQLQIFHQQPNAIQQGFLITTSLNYFNFKLRTLSNF